MTEEVTFTSLEELYKRLKPALTTKAKELHRSGYTYINEMDIWNYLKDEKWRTSVNLLLYQMVDDVINANEISIDMYFKKNLNKG